MDRIDKSGCQGTGNAAQRLGGVEKSHDQVFLLRSGLDGDHALEHRHADGISRINDHAQGDEDPDIGTRAVPRADTVQTAMITAMDRRIFVFVMIQIQSVVLATKDTRPQPP